MIGSDRADFDRAEFHKATAMRTEMRAADPGRFRYDSDIASRDCVRHRRIRLPVNMIHLDIDIKCAGILSTPAIRLKTLIR